MAAAWDAAIRVMAGAQPEVVSKTTWSSSSQGAINASSPTRASISSATRSSAPPRRRRRPERLTVEAPSEQAARGYIVADAEPYVW